MLKCHISSRVWTIFRLLQSTYRDAALIGRLSAEADFDAAAAAAEASSAAEKIFVLHQILLALFVCKANFVFLFQVLTQLNQKLKSELDSLLLQDDQHLSEAFKTHSQLSEQAHSQPGQRSSRQVNVVVRFCAAIYAFDCTIRLIWLRQN